MQQNKKNGKHYTRIAPHLGVGVERVDAAADGGGRQQLGTEQQVPQLGRQLLPAAVPRQLPAQALTQLREPPQLRPRRLGRG